MANRTTLRMGSKGEEVTRLQEALKSRGYPVGSDGDFGPRTRDAVVDFQKKHGIAADGVVGAQTWDALLAKPGEKTITTPITPSSPEFRCGNVTIGFDTVKGMCPGAPELNI